MVARPHEVFTSRAQDDARRTHRALATLSACNQAVVRARSEHDLLRRVCRVIVEECGYRLAWIGYAEHGAAKTVRPIAQAGDSGGYLDGLVISWDDSPTGRGPTGTAIRTGRPYIVQNMQTDPAYTHWRTAARAHGYAAGIALPLTINTHIIGALNIYAVEPDAFDADEEQLLSQLADDISFGIAALRAAAERERAEEARRASEESYRRSEELFRALLENATDLVSIVDARGIFQYVSPSFGTILGHDPASMIGQPLFPYFHPDDLAAVRERWASRLTNNVRLTRSEARLRHADGSWRWVENLVRVALDDPAINGIISNARDITDRKRAEADLQHQALHDTLTGLPNRSLLKDRLEQALLQARREKKPVALLLLDMDRFKEINDTLGHHHGDVLLQQVAERLRQTLRGTDTVARLGGDEFAVLLPGDDAVGAEVTVGKLCAALDAPIVVEGQVLRIRASIGAALCPEHGGDAQTLLRRADVAMYVAKRSGRPWSIYTPDQDQHSRDRLALTTELRTAIDEGLLTLHYQPVADLTDGRVAYVEALARWNHPQRGCVPPDVFIPLAEETGLIGALTTHVLTLALRQYAAWQAQGRHLSIAVNLSMANLHDPALVETILRLRQAHGVPAHGLRVELTETCIMSDQARGLEVLAQLGGAEVCVSVDDFGTGYSSLARLKRLPVDTLKIDRSFVIDMVDDEANAAIVRSTIMMAHALGMRVVAEGVETQAAWAMLADMSCDAAQGYYVSRPQPAADLEHWLCHRAG